MRSKKKKEIRKKLIELLLLEKAKVTLHVAEVIDELVNLLELKK